MASRRQDSGRSESLLLLFVIAVTAPLTTAIALFSWFSRLLTTSRDLSYTPSRRRLHGPSRILLSGANTPTALSLARLFHQQGHTVMAADYEPILLSSSARRSNAITRFYRLSIPRPPDRKKVSKAVKFGWLGTLKHPALQTALKGPTNEELYAADILALMEHEHIDVWIPCEDPTSNPRVSYKALTRAKSVVELAGRSSICPSEDLTARCRNPIAFAELISELGSPVRAPLTILMHTRDELHRALSKATPGTKYKLERVRRSNEVYNHKAKPSVEFESSEYGDAIIAEKHARRNSILTLPEPESVGLPDRDRNTTYHTVSRLSISEQTPWLLREDVQGLRVVSSALVSSGSILAFVAASTCSSIDPSQARICQSGSLATYGHKALHPTSPLHRCLLQFTTQFAAASTRGVGPTPLTIEFVALMAPSSTGALMKLVPTTCDAYLHPSFLLLVNDSATTSASLARLYTNPPPPPKVIDELDDTDADDEGDGTTDPNSSALSGDTLLSTPTMSSPDDFSQSLPITLSANTKVTGAYTDVMGLMVALLLTLGRLLLLRAGLTDTVSELSEGAQRLLLWRDISFESRDVWPWWWELNVRSPAKLIFGMLSRYEK